jgi:hypothetical protein
MADVQAAPPLVAEPPAAAEAVPVPEAATAAAAADTAPAPAPPPAPAEAPRMQSLTFNWTSPPVADGAHYYYTSFSFCDAAYAVGDFVYLIPEDPGAPLYLARIINAFEDTAAEGSDRLCIEVGRGAWG